jgi:hypothetical protein
MRNREMIAVTSLLQHMLLAPLSCQLRKPLFTASQVFDRHSRATRSKRLQEGKEAEQVEQTKKRKKQKKKKKKGKKLSLRASSKIHGQRNQLLSPLPGGPLADLGGAGADLQPLDASWASIVGSKTESSGAGEGSRQHNPLFESSSSRSYTFANKTPDQATRRELPREGKRDSGEEEEDEEVFAEPDEEGVEGPPDPLVPETEYRLSPSRRGRTILYPNQHGRSFLPALTPLDLSGRAPASQVVVHYPLPHTVNLSSPTQSSTRLDGPGTQHDVRHSQTTERASSLSSFSDTSISRARRAEETVD